MKKIISMLVVITMLMGGSVQNVSAAENGKERLDFRNGVLMLHNKNLSMISRDVIEATDVVVMDENVYQKQRLADMFEVLDNGTDIIVSTRNVDMLISDFRPVIQPESTGNGLTAGYFITSDGMEYSVGTIEYALMVEDGYEDYDKATAAAYLGEIVENEPIDATMVMKDKKKINGVDCLNQLDSKDKARLQTATDLGNSFVDNQKFVYFYKYGNVNGTGTDYEYDESTAKNGYSKLGSLSFYIYAIKIKTMGTATYDAIFATCTASGLNDKYVYKFNTSLAVDEDSKNYIIDHTNPEGGVESVTGGISLGVNSSGEVEVGAQTEYTYNPNKLTSVVPACGERYVRTWKCTAYNSPGYNNWSWTVKPAIIVKKTNGTSDDMTASVFVDYFRVSGGFRWYTMTDKVSCSVTFKNHKGL